MNKIKKTNKGRASIFRYVIPIIDVLKENGGSGNTSEIIDKVISKLNIPDREVDKMLPSGSSSVRNRIQWARFYLSKAGYIQTEKRGFWQLTNEGYEIILDTEKVYRLFRSIHREFEIIKPNTKKETSEDLDNEIVEDETHAIILLDTLKGLKPDGFERICKRLLTEIGIQDIIITGKPNDQGIDGTGLIKLNDVVNFNIVFQCKSFRILYHQIM